MTDNHDIAASGRAAATVRGRLRLLATWLLPVGGAVLAVLAVAPQDWSDILGSWGGLLWELRPWLIAVVFVGLVARVIMLQRAPSPGGRVVSAQPDPFPYHTKDREKLNAILGGMLTSGSHHVVRIMVSTGATLLPVLGHYIEDLEPRVEFDIRVLLIDPDSSATVDGRKDWPDEVRSSRVKLEALRARVAELGKPIALEWRFYQRPQPVHGIVLDTDHVFLGFSAWTSVGERRELRGLNQPYLQMHKEQESRGIPESRIALVVNWFDYLWDDQARD